MTTTASRPEQHLYLADTSYAQVRTISEWPLTAPVSLTWHCMAMPQFRPVKQYVAVLNHTPEFRPPPSKRSVSPPSPNHQVKVPTASISVRDIPREPEPPKAHVRVPTASVSVADIPPEPEPPKTQVQVPTASISFEDIPPEPEPPKTHVQVLSASICVDEIPPDPEPPRVQVQVPAASISFEDVPQEPEPPKTQVRVLAASISLEDIPEAPKAQVQVPTASISVEDVPPKPEPPKTQVRVPAASVSFEDVPPEPEPLKAQVRVPSASISFQDIPTEPEPPKMQVRVPAASVSFEDVPPEPVPPKAQVRVPSASICFEDVAPEPEPPRAQVIVPTASISFEDVSPEPEPPLAQARLHNASVNVEHEVVIPKSPERSNTHVILPTASINVEEHHAVLQSFESRNIFANRTFDGNAYQQLDREISPVSHSTSESDRITAEIDTIQLQREDSSTKHDDVVQHASDVSGKGCDSDDSDDRSKEDASEVVDVEALQEVAASVCKPSLTFEALERYTPATEISYGEHTDYLTKNSLEQPSSDDHHLMSKDTDYELGASVRNGIRSEIINTAARKAQMDIDTFRDTEIPQEFSIQKEHDETGISRSIHVEELSCGHEIEPPSPCLPKAVGNGKPFSEYLEKDLTSLTDTDEFLLWSSNTGGEFEEDTPDSSQLQSGNNMNRGPTMNRNVNFLLAKVKSLETEIDDARFSANQTQKLVIELQSKLESSTKACRDLLESVQE